MKSQLRCGFNAISLLIALSWGSLQAGQTYWVCTDAQGSKLAQDQPCDPANPAKNRHEARPNVVPAVHDPVKVPSDVKDVQSDVQSVVQQARDRFPAISPESIKLLMTAGAGVVALLTIVAVWGLLARTRRNLSPEDAGGLSRGGVSAEARLPLLGRPKAWSLLLIRSLGTARFEELCAALWTLKGYRTERRESGSPGGVSLLCFQSDAGGKPAVIVQCSTGAGGEVGVSAVRELFGNLGEFGARHGVLVSASEIAADAKVFAGGKPMELIDGAMLLQQLQALPTGQRHALLQQIARRGYRR